MKKALFADTESSGLVNFERRSNDVSQPHLCQIAGRLIDLDSGVLLASINRIVQQKGWRCAAEAMDVHGITQERSMAEGVPEAEAVAEFFALVQQADIAMAYSMAFDRRMVRTALQRYLDGPDTMVTHPPMVLRVSGNEKEKAAVTTSLPGDYWNSIPSQDVIYLVKPHVKSYSPKTGRPKNPTLEEAHQALIGRPIDGGGHDAMRDVDAMVACYWAVCKLEGAPVPEGAFGVRN